MNRKCIWVSRLCAGGFVVASALPAWLFWAWNYRFPQGIGIDASMEALDYFRKLWIIAQAIAPAFFTLLAVCLIWQKISFSRTFFVLYDVLTVSMLLIFAASWAPFRQSPDPCRVSFQYIVAFYMERGFGVLTILLGIAPLTCFVSWVKEKRQK